MAFSSTGLVARGSFFLPLVNTPHPLVCSSNHPPSPSIPIFFVNPELALKFNALPASPFPPPCTHFLPRRSFAHGDCRGSKVQFLLWSGGRARTESIADTSECEDLGANSAVYQKTLRLVECSMFAAVAGLAYLLSNSLGIENYFGCFFSLPIVISSIRWDVSAGRKTMVATSLLLLVLSGPVKATTYLLMHGLVGFSMGSLWRLGVNWGLSVFLCSFVRAAGAFGYVLLSSFLIRENILALITINIHASLTYVMAAVGINTVLSMRTIYVIFGTLVLLNCGFFVFLVHILYAVLLTRLGMKAWLNLPRWLQRAL